jgi:uncharacterized protein YndB with AHSA1/START domain
MALRCPRPFRLAGSASSVDTVIDNAIGIRHPLAEVFRTASDPRSWPQWYPSSRRTRPTRDGAVEWLRPAGFPLRIGWTIHPSEQAGRIRKTGRIWAIIPVEIVYDLTEEGGATRFRRVMRYRVPAPLTVLDRLLIRPKLRAEAEQALRRLKEMLEGGAVSSECC